MKILLTGFESFLQFNPNPTAEIIHYFAQHHDYGIEIIPKILPVEFERAALEIDRLIERYEPDCIVSLGLAAGRHHITPERVAINVKESTKPDNSGHCPTGEPIISGGQASYFSTLPIEKIVTALKEAGYPATISNTAGTYVCNTVMYKGLHYAQQKGIPAGFIHIPANFELAIQHQNVPGWHQRDLTASIEIALKCIIENEL